MSFYELLQVFPNSTLVRIMGDGCTIFCGIVAELPFAIVRDQTVQMLREEKDEHGAARIKIVLEVRGK